MEKKLSRRDMLKLSGAAIGGITVGAPLIGNAMNSAAVNGNDSPVPPSEKYSYFDSLPVFPLGETLDSNEMRITFLGTSCVPRLSQECNSIFVEVGDAMGGADQFVFDCGSGVIAKYAAMGIPYSKMDKIFFTHLHGDHTSDLIHIYDFACQGDRKWPLYLWGPKNSGKTWTDPDEIVTRGPYDDGLRAFCENFRESQRWHTESQSFVPTQYAAYAPNPSDWGIPIPAPVGLEGDSPSDGYAIVPIELDWETEGALAYDNKTTGVRITSFPVIHCRWGSIGYKLEWNGMSMIFTGDTKPSNVVIRQATNVVNGRAKGVDVLIHEIVMPPDAWTEKNTGLQEGDPGWDQALNYFTQVQNSSHTPQGAFGYILSQISPPPRLTIATHFQAQDDTVASALESIRNHYKITPKHDVTFATDLMVINVSKQKIRQRRAVVSAFAFSPQGLSGLQTQTPIYWEYADDGTKTMAPTAQIDLTDAIDNSDGDKWDPSGY